MKNTYYSLLLSVLVLSGLMAQNPSNISPADWGGPEVSISNIQENWIVKGTKNTLTLNKRNLSMKVNDGTVIWKMFPSAANDMIVDSQGKKNNVRLADAGNISIEKYETGFKSGVKIKLSDFKDSKNNTLDLSLILTVCLEGNDEELVCTVVAIENETKIKQLDWPKALDASKVDYTLVPTGRGNLIPRNWPKFYHPFYDVPGLGENNVTGDTISIIQSNHIECWSMSWWGFKQGASSMIVITETSADAGY